MRSRVLVVAGLSDRMLDCYLSPIQSNREILVDVLRTTPGMAYKGVSYRCPPLTLRKSRILALLWKTIVALRLGFKADFLCIYPIQAVPHLYLGFFVSVLSGRPLIYSVIGGHYEIRERISFLQKLTKKIIRYSHRITAADSKTAAYIRQLGVESERIAKLRNLDLVNLRHFSPSKSNRPVHLIVVSRLEPDKRIEIFVKIVSLLRGSITDLTAAIVGDGSMRQSLLEFVRDEGLSDIIKFHGHIASPVELNRILNTAKIFILNSSHEGGPFTILEAMAAGLCCISSKVGEAPYLIEHGHNGFIVDEYDDVGAYVNLIMMLLHNPTRLLEIQENAAQIKGEQDVIRPSLFWRRLIESLTATFN